MKSEKAKSVYKLAPKKHYYILNTGVVTKDQLNQLKVSISIREELEANWRAGFKSTWDVASDYKIQEGRLCSVGGHNKIYAPMIHKELPGEIAKLKTGDEKAVLQFASSYGEFGYHNLCHPQPDEISRSFIGEPLDWIWAHSRVFNLCMNITEHLQNEDEASLGEYLRDNYASEPWRGLETYRAVIAYKDEIVHKRWSRFAGESLTDLTRYIRMDLINRNISGMRREFQDVEGRDKPFFVFSALIEVAYWQLADELTNSQRLTRCEVCEAPFFQTNNRQRFCPRQNDRKESSCAVKARVRKYRNKKKNDQSGRST